MTSRLTSAYLKSADARRPDAEMWRGRRGVKRVRQREKNKVVERGREDNKPSTKPHLPFLRYKLDIWGALMEMDAGSGQGRKS